MCEIKVIKCDIMTRHSPQYFHQQKINPNWLLMCFQTPFLYYKDGNMIEASAGDAIINSPGLFIKHGPTVDMNTGFQNDWMYFAGENIEELLQEYNLPIDTHFHINNPYFMTKFLQTLMLEKLNCQSHYEKKISNTLHNMLIDLSRCISDKSNGGFRKCSQFEELRNEIFSSVDYNWTLMSMAAKVGYSVSRFCNLYKSMFNISPSADLLQMRIQKAKTLLSCTDIAVGDIAKKSGFSTVHHFSYSFKNSTGMSPTEYRRKNCFFDE